MNMNNMRNVKMPNAGPAGALARLAVIGGIGLYGALNSLYNVEGGHRAIVFNRIVGVKDKVRRRYNWIGNLWLLIVGFLDERR
jgi:prohibitin 2